MLHPAPIQPIRTGFPGSTMTGTVRLPPVIWSIRASASESLSTSNSTKSIPRHSKSSRADAQKGQPGVVYSTVVTSEETISTL